MRGPLEMWRWWRDANGNGHSEANPAEPLKSTPNRPAASFDRARPWLEQLNQARIPRNLNYPSTTLARMLDQSADRFGECTAVVYGNIRWTYRQLLARVNRMAGGLAALGVRRNERVVLTLPNCPELVVSFFAIQKLGAVAVNAGPLMGADDLRAVIHLTAPRVVIGLDLQAGMLREVGHRSTIEHWVWVTLQGYQSVLKRAGYQIRLWQRRDLAPDSSAQEIELTDLLESAPARPPTIEPSPDACAVLQPTSGTTGAVKLAQLSHRNLLANAMQVMVWMNGQPGQDRVLAALPMFHVYGLMLGLVAPVFNASAIVMETRFDVNECIDLLSRERVTIFPLVPAICDAICDELERRNRLSKLHDLRLCISGAAPLPEETARRFETMTGAPVFEGYGLSEAGPVTHANLPTRPRYGSIGLPMPDTQCRIADLDDEQKDAALGQPGELLVSGPQVMSGYFANPEETLLALVTDDAGRTWLRTGDIVRADEDGYFYVIDRRKDMIIRSGLKVYPAKVERVLRTHKSVRDVAVIGRAAPVHTEQVVAVVVPVDTNEDEAALADELRALCRKHLAVYEIPTHFEFVDSIPHSPLGKVLKTVLRTSDSALIPHPSALDKEPSPNPLPEFREREMKKEVA